LHYEVAIKCILKILRQNEWNQMTEMESAGRRAPSSVEKDWFSGFFGVKDLVQFAMGEEKTATHERMGADSGDSFPASKDGGVEAAATEFGEKALFGHGGRGVGGVGELRGHVK
jgi:hypothetical protein